MLPSSRGILGGGKLTEWSLVLVLTFLFFSFCAGGIICRVRRKDRQEIASVMSAKAKVCQDQTSWPKEDLLCSVFPCIYVLLFFSFTSSTLHFSLHAPSPFHFIKSPSLQITEPFNFSILLYRRLLTRGWVICMHESVSTRLRSELPIKQSQYRSPHC